MRFSSASPPRRPRLRFTCSFSSPLLHARVSVDDERAVLRETIEDLRRDLDEERSASSTAASEAMTMILRLQREKAEVQMEARQFQQLTEEKIAYLEGECLRRDRAIDDVLRHLQGYRNRLLDLGVDPDSQPQPRCATPRAEYDLSYCSPDDTVVDIERRISEMEGTGEGVEREEEVVLEKTVFAEGDDGVVDRVYTIDAIHESEQVEEESDMRKLHARLQALEADRESLKEEIVLMRTEKAQVVLLKEIADNLSKGIRGAALHPPPERGPPFFGGLSLLSALKFVLSLAFWTKKTNRCRYMLHHVSGRFGLLLILDKSEPTCHFRFVTRSLIVLRSIEVD